jgi:peroxiredoxin Q/BCP
VILRVEKPVHFITSGAARTNVTGVWIVQSDVTELEFATWSCNECWRTVRGQSLRVGDRVPDFTVPDQEGRAVSLDELLSSGCLVLYFYPKDDTPGCTVEACSFRDQHDELLEAGACVVGVSSDDVDSHRRFATKYGIPFRLLSDKGGKLRRRFGVPRTLGLIDGRVTYVIDSHGVIRHIFNSQLRMRQHVEEALRLVRALRSTRPSKPNDASGASPERKGE